MTDYKTFDDLVFEPWIRLATHAVMKFSNGYGVSVLFGAEFYSNGIDTYELAVLYDDHLCYDTPITNDVLGYITKDQVTEAMIKVQQL